MTTPAKKAPAKRAAKAPAKSTEFAPEVGANGKLSHKLCGHPSTMAGRSACRAAFRKANTNGSAS
jgi:hypothetical protein